MKGFGSGGPKNIRIRIHSTVKKRMGCKRRAEYREGEERVHKRTKNHEKDGVAKEREYEM
jgi:hypothetical protein